MRSSETVKPTILHCFSLVHEYFVKQKGYENKENNQLWDITLYIRLCQGSTTDFSLQHQHIVKQSGDENKENNAYAGDQQLISPYNISILLSSQVMRIKKIIKRRIVFWMLYPQFVMINI